MSLTQAQLSILKADIQAAPILAAKPLNSDGAFDIAAAYNLPAAPAFIVWRTNVPISEIVCYNGFTWTAIDTMTAGKARIWEWMRAAGQLNPSKVNVRQGLQDAFGATQPNILPHLKRQSTRAEKLFASGAGTDATPGLMSFEGSVNDQDVETARVL